jgi:hypothetical protein
MGNGSIDTSPKGLLFGSRARRPVGNPAAAAGFPEMQVDTSPRSKEDKFRVCGAMSQQHGQNGRGNESVPQKFVRLVGCRDPNARAGNAIHRRPAVTKP